MEDWISDLNLVLQQRGENALYWTYECTGAEHEKSWIASVTYRGTNYVGRGGTKAAAKQDCCRYILQTLGDVPSEDLAERIGRYLDENGIVTAKQISDALGVEKNVVNRALNGNRCFRRRSSLPVKWTRVADPNEPEWIPTGSETLCPSTTLEELIGELLAEHGQMSTVAIADVLDISIDMVERHLIACPKKYASVYDHTVGYSPGNDTLWFLRTEPAVLYVVDSLSISDRRRHPTAIHPGDCSLVFRAGAATFKNGSFVTSVFKKTPIEHERFMAETILRYLNELEFSDVKLNMSEHRSEVLSSSLSPLGVNVGQWQEATNTSRV